MLRQRQNLNLSNQVCPPLRMCCGHSPSRKSKSSTLNLAETLKVLCTQVGIENGAKLVKDTHTVSRKLEAPPPESLLSPPSMLYV